MQNVNERIEAIEQWLSRTIRPGRYAGGEVLLAYDQKRAALYAELLQLKGQPLPASYAGFVGEVRS